MRNIHSLSAVVVACTLALTGCGGDDDSTPQPTLTAITEANAAQVSSVVYRAASVLFDVASSSGSLPVGAVVSAASARPGSGLGLASFAAGQLKSVTSRSLPAASGAVGAVTQETFACAGGGTVTELFDDADSNGEESIGDSLTLTFVNCVEEGQTANGVLSFKLTLVSANSIGGQSTFGNFVLSDGTDVIRANGGFNLIVTENAGVSEVYEIAGDSLTSSLNGDEHTLTGFTGSAATDFALGNVTYTFKGGVADTSNGIAVNAETVSAFVARLADDHPGSGTLISAGAGKSQALLEVLSSTLVRISADPEGDGSFTAPVEWSWSGLEDLPD
ncbi:MAG: hypothetical protein ACRC2B_15710 [Rubrivivax sp.]